MKYIIPTTEQITNARALMLAIKAKHDLAKKEVEAIKADMFLPSGRAKNGMRESCSGQKEPVKFIARSCANSVLSWLASSAISPR
jgi:hypothetical protein